MVDYIAWASVDLLTIDEAGYLWAGIDPSLSSSNALPSNVLAAVAPRLQMLRRAILSGALVASSANKQLAKAWDFAGCIVHRADLMRLAESFGEAPAFLFPPSRRPLPAPAATQADTVTASQIKEIIAAGSPLMKQAERIARRELEEAEQNDRRQEEALGRAAERAEAQRPAQARDARPTTTVVAELEGRDADDKAVLAYLVTEQARLIKAGEPHGLAAVRLYLPSEFRHLSRDGVDRFYKNLNEHLKAKPGPRGPRKNK